jgi:acyl-CoA synthetase (AMP-forming)/AMP-acid ligase II
VNTQENTVAILRRHARERPEAVALRFLADGEDVVTEWSYRRLAQRVSSIARRLAEAGARGERVILLYDSGPEYIAAFMGVLQAGGIAVPTYPPMGQRPLSRLISIIQDAAPRFVLSTARTRDTQARRVAELSGHGALEWVASDELPTRESHEDVPVVEDQPLAMLQYTSGSTGSPKGVMVTHANLLSNCETIARWLGPSEGRRGGMWLPLFHDMGLLGGVMQPLYSGFPLLFMDPMYFIQRPVRWLRAISKHRLTLSGAPNFAYELCATQIPDDELQGLDLSCWSEAFCGAEPVRSETMRRFAERFAAFGFRAEALSPCYGLAEATLLVAGKPAGTRLRTFAAPRQEDGSEASLEPARELVSSGRVVHAHTVRIIDPDTLAECSQGQVGEVWVHGPSVALGYWGREEESRQSFQATLPGDPAGYLRTGDLGLLHEGELFISGRRKNVIIIAGRNHHAEDVEQTAEAAHDQVRKGGVAAFPVTAENEERLVLVVELKPDGRRTEAGVAAVREGIIQAVVAAHGVRPHDVFFGSVGAISRTTSGKIQRQATRQAYLGGALPALKVAR